MDQHIAQDAIMSGQARFEKWQTEFMQNWQQPAQQQQLKQYYAMVPPDAKDAMMRQDPEGFAKLQAFLQKKK